MVVSIPGPWALYTSPHKFNMQLNRSNVSFATIIVKPTLCHMPIKLHYFSEFSYLFRNRLPGYSSLDEKHNSIRSKLILTTRSHRPTLSICGALLGKFHGKTNLRRIYPLAKKKITVQVMKCKKPYQNANCVVKCMTKTKSTMKCTIVARQDCSIRLNKGNSKTAHAYTFKA
jgi:hypothetical protein